MKNLVYFYICTKKLHQFILQGCFNQLNDQFLEEFKHNIIKEHMQEVFVTSIPWSLWQVLLASLGTKFTNVRKIPIVYYL